jgi:hypothetical protein
MSVAVAVCYKTDVGPEISFYVAESEEAAGRYVVDVTERSDYITHSFLPLVR